MTFARSGGRTRTTVVALVATLGIAAFAAERWLPAADHRDSMTLTNDQDVDIADVYSFQSPADPSNLVLAMTVPGLVPPTESRSFGEDALYQFKIDNDGDAAEDLVIQAFATGSGSSQTVHFRGPAEPVTTGAVTQLLPGDDAASVQISTGASAITATGGGLTVFAGVRDDPFFFDLARFNEIRMGMATAFRDPGVDTFAGSNALAIVVELPASMVVGDDPTIGVWGTASR
jgi:hypothetical protein